MGALPHYPALRELTLLDAPYFRSIVTNNLDDEQLVKLKLIEKEPLGRRARGNYVDPTRSHKKRVRAKRRSEDMHQFPARLVKKPQKTYSCYKCGKPITGEHYKSAASDGYDFYHGRFHVECYKQPKEDKK